MSPVRIGLSPSTSAQSGADALREAGSDPLLDALAVLAGLLERPVSAETLRAGLPLEDGRLTPALLARAAGRAGLAARLRARPLDAIADGLLPCLLLQSDGSACVLVERRTDGTLVVALPDTGDGRVVVDAGALAETYAGFALFARPRLEAPQARGQAAEPAGRTWFWGALARQWPVYVQVAIAAAMINMFALASPLFVMNVYDRVVPNAAIDTLWVLAIGALTVFVFDFVLRTLRGYFVDSAGRAADLRIASSIFEQVMGLRMAARPASAGAFASNLREYETLRDFFTSATVVALVDLPFVLFFLAIVWLIGGPLVTVPAVAIPFVLLIGLIVQIPLDRAIRRTFREAAAKHGLLVEALAGLETLKALGGEGRMQERWEGYVAATAETGSRVRLLSALTVNAASTAANVVAIGVVIWGVYRIADGELTVGALIACSLLSSRAMAPLGQIAGLLARFNQSKTALRSLDQVMALPVERPTDARFLHRPDLAGGIEFKQVTFAYPGQKLPALRDVTFRIGRGERVGLVGRTGSGKSTIEKLVLGLYEPEQGAVLIDGTDLRQLDPADLRRAIGCVPQDVLLFNGSVRDNIALGTVRIDDEAVLRAARLAGVDEFTGRHPLGFDLQVGERGQALSGGQRQTVALARALVSEPPILVLDEPTSAMDNGAEARLKLRLEALLPGRTLMLVTHRASLLTLVDRVIVLDGGKVVADGPRDDVLRSLATGQIRAEA
ncbi:type I secretion system permease/ATPase [Marinivivus vitaminiproducens]|uniref:type I secretion system permease/ATPase n=1 Tax=Marinivivus vitaminiproducens TaxID=3035935 RepID=UPI0027A5719E|nr:type I secretion system permease/ATPase [Geminicoccaceae bacterium SCSIO 64248]